MRWQDIENEKEKYAAYLCSREWSETKNAIRARCHGKCERCLRFNMESVHHLTYIRKFFERLSDLQAVCNQCHEYIHGKSNYDPREDKSIALVDQPAVAMPELSVSDLLAMQSRLREKMGIDVTVEMPKRLRR